MCSTEAPAATGSVFCPSAMFHKPIFLGSCCVLLLGLWRLLATCCSVPTATQGPVYHVLPLQQVSRSFAAAALCLYVSFARGLFPSWCLMLTTPGSPVGLGWLLAWLCRIPRGRGLAAGCEEGCVLRNRCLVFWCSCTLMLCQRVLCQCFRRAVVHSHCSGSAVPHVQLFWA